MKRIFLILALLLSTPAWADYWTKHGTFTLSGGATPYDQAVTGLPGQPKAIKFWTNAQTTTGFTASSQIALGFTVGASSSYCISNWSSDAAATSVNYRMSHAAAICLIDSGGLLNLAFNLKTFDSTGFTVTVTTAYSSGQIIHYFAWGGSDITGAAVNQYQLGASTGNTGYTGVGFKPDYLYMMSILSTTASIETTHAQIAVGSASSTSAQWTIAATARSGQTSSANINAQSRQITSAVLAGVDIYDNTDFSDTLYSLDSDGFTLNQTVAPNNGQYYFWTLSLKGGNYKVGAWNKNTAGAPVQDTVSGLGFTPTGVDLASWNFASSTSLHSNYQFSIGAGTSTDGTQQGSSWQEEQDNQINTVADRDETTKALTLATAASTTDAAADLYSLASGQFIMNWTTNNGTASEILYAAFGSSGGAPPGPGIIWHHCTP